MNKDIEFECQFCFKKFVKESSLFAHQCAKKMRWLDKDNKNVIVGFTAWKRFYQLTNATGKSKTYKDFVDSKFYNDFVNFGRWSNDGHIINPNAYIDYLIKGNFKLKDWTKDSVYDTFLSNILLKEDPDEALERSIRWLQNWSEQNNESIGSFFEKTSTNKLVDILRSGKISPWILFLANNSNEIFDRFDNSQIKLLNNLLDQKVWSYKLKKYQKDIKEYREMLRIIGL